MYLTTKVTYEDILIDGKKTMIRYELVDIEGENKMKVYGMN